MTSPPPPFRDHVTAMSVAVLVQLLFLLFILYSQTGGLLGSQSALDESSGDGSDRIKVVFLPAENRGELKPPSQDRTVAAHAVETSETSALPPISDNAATRTTASLSRQMSYSLPNQATSSLDTASRRGDATTENSDDLYLSAVRAAIMREWQAQGGGTIPTGCEVALDQAIDAKGAKAIHAWTVNCEALPIRERIRLETAALQAQLPYAGYESVFQSHLEFTY